MTNREIMQQALDQLVRLADDLRRIPSDIAQTIAALEAALVQPEQERMIHFKDGKMSYIDKPWQGLTQEDIDKSWEWAQKSSPYGVTRIETFAKSIETKLKELNT